MSNVMTEQEFSKLYQNGYGRTMEFFLKYFNQEDAEEYTQDVYERVWQIRDKWDRKYSIVLFWHLQVRFVISRALDKKKKAGENVSFIEEMSEVEDESKLTERGMDVERLLSMIQDVKVAEFAVLLSMGYSGPEATDIINQRYEEQTNYKRIRRQYDRLLDRHPDIQQLAGELLTDN